MVKYDNLIIDVMNTAYRTFNHKAESPAYVSKKAVYKKAVCNFIRKIEELKTAYCHSDANIYLLFDNPTSRIDLQSSFYFASRKESYAKYKADRAKESKEFYNSIGLLKYYYLVIGPEYHTIQINKLEADDLVKPTLELYNKEPNRALLISNDLDWTRYLSSRVDWMPHWGIIESKDELSQRLGFPASEQNIVAYKAIFGDASDNIPAIASSTLQDSFIAMCGTFKEASELPIRSCSKEEIERFPVLQHIAENERQYRINLQLVNAIPVSAEHIRVTTTSGRSSHICKQAVEKSIGLVSADTTFKFGGITRPRES